MAVCNLFNKFNNPSGNFMMFSQYVEDITHNYVEGDNWKVVPTKFVALNIDYSDIDTYKVLPNGEDLNTGIPKYFQNCFENACAYGREHYAEWANSTTGINIKSWTPEISRNLFWNCMFDGELIHREEYGEVNIIKEVVYYGDINMHSYNEHQGMGYGEIYCYIPTDAEKKRCKVISVLDSDTDERKFQIPEFKSNLEGHTDKFIENYLQTYYYNKDFSMSFDTDGVGTLLNSTDTKYEFNTIVVLYDVFKKINEDWQSAYSCIPMGMYITGVFDNDKISNTVTKYVTTSYGVGTSYGLRICTRFSVSPNGAIINYNDIVTDRAEYSNMAQLMTAMNENLSRMLDICKVTQDTSNQYKEMLSIFRNNKTNVPYVKEVNGVDFWFVNGKPVSSVSAGMDANGCMQLSPSTIQKRIDNLRDNDPDNDFSYIEDNNGCDCNPLSNWELADALGVDYDGPEFGGGTTGGSGGVGGGGGSIPDINWADDADVADIMNSASMLK